MRAPWVEVLLAMPRAGEVRAALVEHSELHVPEHFNALARRLDVGLVTLEGGLAAVAAKEGRLVQLETGTRVDES